MCAFYFIYDVTIYNTYILYFDLFAIIVCKIFGIIRCGNAGAIYIRSYRVLRYSMVLILY